MAITDIEEKLAANLAHGINTGPLAFGVSFLDVFKKGFKGNARAKLVSGLDNKSTLENGLLLRNAIHYMPTAPEGDLQATLNTLQLAKENLKNKVKYLLTFDGTYIAARDIGEGDYLTCTLEELKHEFFFFSVLYGEPRYIAAQENKADQKAAVALSKVYSALRQSDPEWAQEHGHDVNTFMTRLLFCLFAEDTDLFTENLFTKTLVSRGGQYGQDAQNVLRDIYRILNVDENSRQQEPQWLCQFPYVNGDVFALDDIHIPKFNVQAFHYLKEAGESIDWREVHADILGSAIQKITDPAERHSLGMHYTSVTNIDKLIGPLFFDSLREARAKANASGARRVLNLQKLLMRIGQIKVLDPACGSGNFLVIAYKRLRELEIQLLEDLMDAGEQQVDLFSQISLENFFGIEYADFAAETAKVSLRIVEQQMDAAYGLKFNKPSSCLPLRGAPNIHTGSALSIDWNVVCPAKESDEIYICGNPPYLGTGSRHHEQRAEQDAVMLGRIGNGGRKLDYVCNWLVCAHAYCSTIPLSKFAFVATNSVMQGVQVPVLWPYLLSENMEISFAYPSFKWSNLAGGDAKVTCVIIGMQHKGSGAQRLLLKTGEVRPANINPYLLDAKNICVQPAKDPLNKDLPLMLYGSKPVDDGHLHMTVSERDEMVKEHPESNVFIRRVIGSQECLKDIERYCLRITDSNADEAMSIEPISVRLNSVRKMRLNSSKEPTRLLATRPYAFAEDRHAEQCLTLVVPIHSSGERKILPVMTCDNGEVVNNSAFAISHAQMWHLSILSSTLHRCWLATIGGRIKKDYRYSNTLVWNTFPMPVLTDAQKATLNKTGQDIINARYYQPDLTLGDMYNTENMGPELIAAHKANDDALESIFTDKPFKDDSERLSHLFARYADMTRSNT